MGDNNIEKEEWGVSDNKLEFAKMLRTAMTECKSILEKVITSDDESVKSFYVTADKAMDATS